MVIRMRTTVIIDDHVLKEAKRRALETGMSLSDLTTMALREILRKGHHPSPPSRFSLPTYGAGTKRASSAREIADLRDEGR
jgi:hypothetical protein